MRAGGAEVEGEVFGTGDPSPTGRRGCGGDEFFTLSVKNQRFLTALPEGEPRALLRRRKVLGAEEGRLCGRSMSAPTYTTGNAAISPGTNGNTRCFTAREAERLPYGKTGGWAGLLWGGAGWEVVPHTSSVTSGDSFSSRRSLRRCRAGSATSAPISQIGTK